MGVAAERPPVGGWGPRPQKVLLWVLVYWTNAISKTSSTNKPWAKPPSGILPALYTRYPIVAVSHALGLRLSARAS